MITFDDDSLYIRAVWRLGWRRLTILLAGYLGLLFAVLLIGLPIYWTVIGSFKTSREIYSALPTWIPQQPTLQNYVEAWKSAPFGRYYINSIITSLLGTGAEIIMAITSAYALVFLRFPRKNLIFILLLMALMVPDEIVIIPNYITVSRLDWINTYAGIVVPGASIAIGTFLLRQAFRSLPYEVIEAAHVDGAGHIRILWSIVLPMAMPAIVTMGMLSLISKWNEFLWPLIVTNTSDMRTLPIGILLLRNSEGVINWGVVMAGSLFVIIPLLLVFLYVQRYVVDGIAAGAIKG